MVNANTVIIKEIPDAIRLHQKTNRLTSSPEHLGASLFAKLKSIDDEQPQYASLTLALHRLGLLLEVERLNFKRIADFATRADVQRIVHDLRTDFATQLALEDPNPTRQP